MKKDKLAAKRAWYVLNRDRAKAYKKIYYNLHKEEAKAYQKMHYQAHKEEAKTYRDTHKKEIQAYNDARREVVSSQKKANRKQWVLWLSSILKLECSSCGFNRNFCAIDFHHTDPERKEYNIGSFFTNKCSIEKQEELKKEIEGTILLCDNCHRILHFG